MHRRLPREYRRHHGERRPGERREVRSVHGGGGKLGKRAEPKTVIGQRSAGVIEELRALSAKRKLKVPERLTEHLKKCFGIYNSGIGLVRQGRFLEANKVFSDIVSDYLGGNEGVPRQVGVRAINLARTISRAHVLANLSKYSHEASYGEERRELAGIIEDFNQFEIANQQRDSLSRAVKTLGLVGETVDFLPMQEISIFFKETHMDTYCAHAIEHILVRDGLMRLIGAGRERLGGFGISPGRLSNRVLAERLYPLVSELGFGYLMRLTGGAAGVPAGVRSPRDTLIGRDRLDRLGWPKDVQILGETIRLTTQTKLLQFLRGDIQNSLKRLKLEFSSNPLEAQDAPITQASRDLLLKSGIIEGSERGVFTLSQKGREFVTFLVRTNLNAPQASLRLSQPRPQLPG